MRASSPEQLFDALCRMTRQHFAIARHLWSTRDPDFLMMVEIGPDRLHHAFFAELDPNHPRHDPNSSLRDVGERYYALLDDELRSAARRWPTTTPLSWSPATTVRARCAAAF